MRHRLGPGSCLRLAEQLRRDGGTIEGLDLPRSDADDFTGRLDEETERALSGDLPTATADWATIGKGAPIAKLPAALMRHIGLDVDAVRHMSGLIPEWLEIQTATAMPSCLLRGQGSDDDFVAIPGVGRWTGTSDGRLVVTRALPDTIMSDMLVGRRLRDVVDHPVLNGFGLTIAHARRLDHASGMEFRLSA